MEIQQVFDYMQLVEGVFTFKPHIFNPLDPIYVFGSNQGTEPTARMTQLYQAVNSVEVLQFITASKQLIIVCIFSQRMSYMYMEMLMML